MIVAKTANMVKMMNIKLIGLAEFSKLRLPALAESRYGFTATNRKRFYQSMIFACLANCPRNHQLAQITEKGLDFNDTQIKTHSKRFSQKNDRRIKNR